MPPPPLKPIVMKTVLADAAANDDLGFSIYGRYCERERPEEGRRTETLKSASTVKYLPPLYTVRFGYMVSHLVGPTGNNAWIKVFLSITVSIHRTEPFTQ